MEEIARVNLLLELLSECAMASDVGTLLRCASARIRWVLGFEQLVVALVEETGCSYWQATSGSENLRSIGTDDVPASHVALLEVSLSEGLPSSTGDLRTLSHALPFDKQVYGALSLSSATPFSYSDMRLVHHIAQCLGATLGRISQAATICQQQREAFETRTALESASAENQAKDEFLAMLGHELRNPLAPIVTATHLLRMFDDGRSSEEIDIIERQSRHLVAVVDDLLDLAQLTNGKLTISRCQVALADVIERAIENATPSLALGEHQLEVALATNASGEGPTVYGDPSRLVQVFSSLLINAAKYTASNGNVRIASRWIGESVTVEVQDDGLGISKDMLPRVFDRFVQAPQPCDRPQGGLGLGLAIAKAITELHDGSIRAASHGLGRGSCFAVTLPTVAPKASPNPVARHLVQSSSRRRVLVVDDNFDAAVLLSKLLAQLGHDVTVARNGIAALAILTRTPPDVALLDIGLPGMDGYCLAREIRSRFGSAAPRLVAVTGYGQPDDRELSARAGFAAHLVKPADTGELLVAIDRCFGE